MICSDWFVPGFRAGGPIKSCANLVALLRDDVNMRIITANRDLGERQPYAGLPANKWLLGSQGEQIFYGSSGLRRMVAQRSEFVAMPDTVYLNGMFSLVGTFWPLSRVRRLAPQTRVVLAPRGMLKPSALQQKGWKKRPFLYGLRKSGLMQKVLFHATSQEELEEIEVVFGRVDTKLVPNVPSRPANFVPSSNRLVGQVKLCLVGRVHPIKNVLWLIELLSALRVRCELDVIGPIEDRYYFEKCRAAAAKLPAHVRVQFIGGLQEAEVQTALADVDAMILPTQGENFGHAIFESLAVGTPVIISDRTIWRGLASQHAGWDLELTKPSAFLETISFIAGMDEQTHQQWRRGALCLARHYFNAQSLREGYLDLFFG